MNLNKQFIWREYFIKTKNKKQEKAVEAFLSDLKIEFYTEAQEEAVLLKAMQKDRKSKLLNFQEKEEFMKVL